MSLEEKKKAILEYYYDNPIAFVQDILKAEPTEQQKIILNSVRKNRKISVRSGRGIGKSSCAAFIILWFLCTRYLAKVAITAPTSTQIDNAIWAEVARWFTQMDDLFKQDFTITSRILYNKKFPKTWKAAAVTTGKDKPEALQGWHADNLLIIVDEASGVIDPVFTSLMGSLTSGDQNKILLLSNPTRLSGYFFDSQKPSSDYDRISLSSSNSTLVDDGYIKELENKYGAESNVYRVHVLGEFPRAESDALIQWEWLDTARSRYDKTAWLAHHKHCVWGLDVAAGGDKSVLAIRYGTVLHEFMKFQDKDTMETVGRVTKLYNEIQESKKPIKVFVDSDGLGKGAADRLKENGLPVVYVHGAARPNDVKQYVNAKAEMWHSMRDWLRDEEPMIVDDKYFIEQAGTYRAKNHSSGKFQMESKDDYKKRNPKIGSPDEADAVSLTFYKEKKFAELRVW